MNHTGLEQAISKPIEFGNTVLSLNRVLIDRCQLSSFVSQAGGQGQAIGDLDAKIRKFPAGSLMVGPLKQTTTTWAQIVTPMRLVVL